MVLEFGVRSVPRIKLPVGILELNRLVGICVKPRVFYLTLGSGLTVVGHHWLLAF
jgi:hypothetical protein